MPKGVYRHEPLSEEHKKNISNAVKGKKAYWWGKHHSEETKQRLREINLGKHLSKETRKKISEAHQQRKEKFGYINSLEARKKISKAKMGHTVSEKTRKKISKAKKGKNLGENSPQWRGGISFEPYSIEFNETLKEKIRKRDNYRCQQCFRHQDELYTKSGRKYKLSIHHIDYNKKNNDPSNLISLCRNCHSQTNFKRSDWIKYFQTKLYV